MRRETNDGRARGPSSDKYLQRRSPAAPSLTRVDPDEHDRQMENPPSPPCPCLTRQARARELWTKIHIHHIPFSGSTISHPHPSRSLLWPCLVILLPPSHLHPHPRPLIHNPTRRRARRQSAPGPLPKSCLGQGKHQMRVWASLTLGLVIHRLCQYGPWGHGSIHTTMAQPLAFLILDDVCYELEPFRRRMVRRGMKSSPRNLSCPVPMQRPMSRLKRELGHKVVDRYGWVVDGYGYGCG